MLKAQYSRKQDMKKNADSSKLWDENSPLYKVRRGEALGKAMGTERGGRFDGHRKPFQGGDT